MKYVKWYYCVKYMESDNMDEKDYLGLKAVQDAIEKMLLEIKCEVGDTKIDTSEWDSLSDSEKDDGMVLLLKIISETKSHPI